MEFNPWPGKIPQATELLSPHSRAQELQLWNPCAAAIEACTPRASQHEKPSQREAHTPQQKNGGPCSLQLEKALAKQQRPSTAKNENKVKRKKKNTKRKEGPTALVSVVLILLHLLNKNLPHSEVP